MPATLERLNTIGQIARRADSDIHRVEYFIRSRGIVPRGMAGNARVFTEADAELIVEEIRRIDAARTEVAR